jgi:hypothetical protein
MLSDLVHIVPAVVGGDRLLFPVRMAWLVLLDTDTLRGLGHGVITYLCAFFVQFNTTKKTS